MAEANSVIIESSDEEENSELKTPAAHIYIGDKSLGSCTVTWPLPALLGRQGSIVIKTHGSGHSTKSTTIPVPVAEVTCWYLREAEQGPVTLVIRTAPGGGAWAPVQRLLRARHRLGTHCTCPHNRCFWRAHQDHRPAAPLPRPYDAARGLRPHGASRGGRGPGRTSGGHGSRGCGRQIGDSHSGGEHGG
jgi:hypothetical protein